MLNQNQQFGSGDESQGGYCPSRRYELIVNLQYKNTYSFHVAVYNPFRVHILDALGHLEHLIDTINYI